jgi:hypothetical protein
MTVQATTVEPAVINGINIDDLFALIQGVNRPLKNSKVEVTLPLPTRVFHSSGTISGCFDRSGSLQSKPCACSRQTHPVASNPGSRTRL